jgi:hypothetical protein
MEWNVQDTRAGVLRTDEHNHFPELVQTLQRYLRHIRLRCFPSPRGCKNCAELWSRLIHDIDDTFHRTIQRLDLMLRIDIPISGRASALLPAVQVPEYWPAIVFCRLKSTSLTHFSLISNASSSSPTGCKVLFDWLSRQGRLTHLRLVLNDAVEIQPQSLPPAWQPIVRTLSVSVQVLCTLSTLVPLQLLDTLHIEFNDMESDTPVTGLAQDELVSLLALVETGRFPNVKELSLAGRLGLHKDFLRRVLMCFPGIQVLVLAPVMWFAREGWHAVQSVQSQITPFFYSPDDLSRHIFPLTEPYAAQAIVNDCFDLLTALRALYIGRRANTIDNPIDRLYRDPARQLKVKIPSLQLVSFGNCSQSRSAVPSPRARCAHVKVVTRRVADRSEAPEGNVTRSDEDICVMAFLQQYSLCQQPLQYQRADCWM